MPRKEYENNRKKLLKVFNDYQKSSANDEIAPHVLQFIAAVLEYNEQLERLEILLNNVEQFHKDEKNIEFADDKQ